MEKDIDLSKMSREELLKLREMLNKHLKDLQIPHMTTADDHFLSEDADLSKLEFPKDELKPIDFPSKEMDPSKVNLPNLNDTEIDKKTR